VKPKKRRAKRARAAHSTFGYTCPHCGEEVDTFPDPGAGELSEYIEDCAVCCRPNRIVARYSIEEGDYVLEVTAE
jgi:hypothetical protein